MKKKIVTIIVAICAFITALVTNFYYIVDEDPNTQANVTEVVEKAKDVKDAINIETNK